MFDLNKTFGDSKENKVLIQNLILSKNVKENWPSIVGDVLLKSLKFQYIVYDYCTIMVDSAVWFTEIKFYENQILEKINNTLKIKRKIRRLHLIVSEKGRGDKKTPFANKRNYDTMIGR